MTIETWEKEFYPIPAGDVANNLEATKHSLQKWRGLLPENLKKHNVTKNPGSRILVDENQREFHIDGESCALCALNFDTETESCADCPISDVNEAEVGCYPCDDAYRTGLNYSPKNMIDLLDETLKFVEGKENDN